VLVITVTRKPLDVTTSTVATNALKHGVGGINIDAPRVSYAVNEPDSGANFYRNRGQAMPENRTNYFRGEDHVVKSTPSSVGRWPANLIMSHLPDCRCNGLAKMTPTEGHRPNPVAVQSDGEIRFSRKPVGYQKVSYTGEDGKETVESWDCVEGCPVSALDDQSGILKSGSGDKNSGGNKSNGMTLGHGLGKGVGIGGDQGGASRFFKVVQ